MPSIPPLQRSQTDAELTQLASNGDAQAFTELIERHSEKMGHLATRYLRNDSDAQDAVQDAFLNAWIYVPRFRGDAAFGSWLHRVTANACLMTLRRKRRRPEFPLPPDRADLLDLHAVLPDAWIEARQLGRALRLAIDNLPPHYREVFELADLHDFSMGAIAQQTGLSRANVKTRLHRARLKLRVALSDYLDTTTP